MAPARTFDALSNGAHNRLGTFPSQIQGTVDSPHIRLAMGRRVALNAKGATVGDPSKSCSAPRSSGNYFFSSLPLRRCSRRSWRRVRLAVRRSLRRSRLPSRRSLRRARLARRRSTPVLGAAGGGVVAGGGVAVWASASDTVDTVSTVGAARLNTASPRSERALRREITSDLICSLMQHPPGLRLLTLRSHCLTLEVHE